jgi:glyoxylase-like metal-dependent hydrolase (beta-lactamase superfamily II)
VNSLPGGRIQQIRPGLHRVPLPGVNAFLLESPSDGLILVDTGVQGCAGKIEDALRTLGKFIGDVRHILVTHCHPDHAGSLAALQSMTSARTYMHHKDAALVATGRAMRRLVPTPGLLNAVLFRLMIEPKPTTVDPAQVDVLLGDGDEIPIAGGISVVHTPGHSEGHVVFLAREHGVAFLGDAAANFFGLRLMPAYEHLQQGMMSLRHLCRYDFEAACFGHGPPITRRAVERFRRRWGATGDAKAVPRLERPRR